MCQGAAVTGHQCDGSGEEVRKCSDQRCPGEPKDNKLASEWKQGDNYLCGVNDTSHCIRSVKTGSEEEMLISGYRGRMNECFNHKFTSHLTFFIIMMMMMMMWCIHPTNFVVKEEGTFH